MNKLIATIALAALAFTSCIKENDTWKEMLPVQPGMYIYQLATDQDKLAMRPANAALRLAMLLAEADKQGEDVLSADLKEIVVKKGDASIKVWETLFGAHTKLERQGENQRGEGAEPILLFCALDRRDAGSQGVRLHEYRSAAGVQFR